ncbi:MAG: hypothetical protein HYX92_08645 [Chloroflexi bacterium]|nr:hypothetical protein [Chloroflexota bacterium]
MKIRRTRRNKLFAGVGGLLLVIAAVLLVLSFVGVPPAGKLLGGAYNYAFSLEEDRTYGFYLSSGWFGLATGVVRLKNRDDKTIMLKSEYVSGDRWVACGTDTLEPGQDRHWDFKGSWRVKTSPPVFGWGGLALTPTIVDVRESGGGGGEWGLQMGPYGRCKK